MHRIPLKHPRARGPGDDPGDAPTQVNRDTIRCLLDRGYSKAAIAKELGLSERHVRQILRT